MTQTKKGVVIQLENNQRKAHPVFEHLNTLRLIRWVGYGLLTLFLFDFIATFIPFRLMNPNWEFQTFGTLVERVAVPLLAFVLVFAGQQFCRWRWEKPCLKILSWSALMLGIFYLILIPLGVVNTIRLERQANRQVTNQVQQQMEQIEAVKTFVDSASSSEEIASIYQQLGGQNFSANAPLESLKEETSSLISRGTQSLENEANATLDAQRLGLFKNSLKWTLGAFVASCLFFIIWRSTYKWTKTMSG